MTEKQHDLFNDETDDEDSVSQVKEPKSHNFSQIGTAGEHFVAYEFTAAGYPATQGPEGAAYDIAVTVGGRLHGVQVKSTRRIREGPLAWSFTAGQGHSYNGNRVIHHAKTWSKYLDNNIHVVAFVALPVRRCIIMPTANLLQDSTSMGFTNSQMLNDDFFKLNFNSAIQCLNNQIVLDTQGSDFEFDNCIYDFIYNFDR